MLAYRTAPAGAGAARPPPALPPLDGRSERLLARLSSRLECLRVPAERELIASDDPLVWGHVIVRMVSGPEGQRGALRGLVDAKVGGAIPLRLRQPRAKDDWAAPVDLSLPEGVRIAMADLASTSAIGALEALLTPSNSWERDGAAVAVRLLAGFDPRASGPALCAALASRAELFKRGGPVSGEVAFGRLLVAAIDLASPDAAPGLLARLAAEGGYELQRQVTKVLARRASPAVVEALAERSYRPMGAANDALESLENLARAHGFEAVAGLLGHANPAARGVAIKALGRSELADRGARLREALGREGDATNRRLALDALVAADPKAGAELLGRELLLVATPYDFEHALGLLEQLADPRSRPALRRALEPGVLERVVSGAPVGLPAWLADSPVFEALDERVRRDEAEHGAQRRRAQVDQLRARIVALLARL